MTTTIFGPGEVQVGIPALFEVTTSGWDGVTPEYLWFTLADGGTWQHQGDWTTSSSFSWTPASPGNYTMGVWFRPQGLTPPNGSFSETDTHPVLVQAAPEPSLPEGRLHWQSAFSALVPTYVGSPNGMSSVTITPELSVLAWKSVPLPYTVPQGKWLYITDLHFGSKHVVMNGNDRSSYMVVEGVGTLTEHGDVPSLRTPFIVPSGKKVGVTFMNNSVEAQWMNGWITGYLDDPIPSV